MADEVFHAQVSQNLPPHSVENWEVWMACPEARAGSLYGVIIEHATIGLIDRLRFLCVF